ncbi:hypothetical protein [Actinocrispum sp. NPDC049592]|uniref:hypothetical protein n=1 Tax=Actinocrispum sp. NPDC049592 TaxID=3154835 RepID=UPI00341AB479
MRERESLPPFEMRGYWSAEGQAEMAVTLAHLLAASSGKPIALSDIVPLAADMWS